MYNKHLIINFLKTTVLMMLPNLFLSSYHFKNRNSTLLAPETISPENILDFPPFLTTHPMHEQILMVLPLEYTSNLLLSVTSTATTLDQATIISSLKLKELLTCFHASFTTVFHIATRNPP